MDNFIIKYFFDKLKEREFDLVVGVPCSLLSGLISYAEKDKSFRYICASSEGEAVAIAVGAYLSGKKALVFCQNSGLGNMVNPLTSLVYPFRIPLLIISSWRGKPSAGDAPQHALMGHITLKILNMLEINTLSFPMEKQSIQSAMQLIDLNFSQGISTCLIVEEKIKYQAEVKRELSPKRNQQIIISHSNSNMMPLTRWKTLGKLIEFFPSDAAFLSTTGKTGGELFTINDRCRNFYMIGSMGHAGPIGLGVSLYTSKNVVVLDGDGALLMKMGNMATIGHYAPQTLFHVLLNNNVHDSTGGQSNASDTVDFIQVAKGCNYSTILDVDTDNFENSLQKILNHKGPYFIHIKTLPGSEKSLGRPTLIPEEIAKRFSTFLQQ